MKLTVRTRLTLSLALVFLAVLVILLGAGATALYLRLTEEVDASLKTEAGRAIQLFESEYLELTSAAGHLKDSLETELTEDLNDLYGHKREFVIFSLTSEDRRVYSGGGIKSIDGFLTGGLFPGIDGYFHHEIDGAMHRILISSHLWGSLALGAENLTFFHVADEVKEILLIGFPVTLVLFLVGGRFLAGLVMKPVVAAAEAAEKITLAHLEQRLPDYGGKDEFGKLVGTLNSMIAQIEEGVKRVRQFTQDAAHELRTPLTILRGELELIYQKENLSEEVRASLQKVLDRAIAMGKIVENLMLLAQSDTGRYPIRATRFHLDQVLKEIVEDARALAEKRPVTVSLNDCDKSEFVGDEQLIRHLLLNVCDNALKYTREGTIRFGLSRSDAIVLITIQDTGIGIPKEDVPHVFERFYRVDKARTGGETGSGLGLAICQWIVAAHDGSIRMESEVGKGTTISIILPTTL